jgi:hypothetical protein
VGISTGDVGLPAGFTADEERSPGHHKNRAIEAFLFAVRHTGALRRISDSAQ